MKNQELKITIDAAWDARDSVNTETKGEIRDAVQAALNLLDNGQERVAEPKNDPDPVWQVNQAQKSRIIVIPFKRYGDYK